MSKYNNRLFNKIHLKDFILTLCLFVMTILFIYLYVNSQARNKLWLKSYPLRAELSVLNISCSKNSPKWMEDIIINKVKVGNAPSNQLAYIDKSSKLHYCQNGYIDKYPIISNGITDKTRFRYASVTKLWTSDVILQLVKQRKIKLDDPISKYLTEIKNPKDPRIANITIRQLLLHRGGFDRNSVFGNDMFGIGRDICPNHLSQLNNIKLNFNPGEKKSYSNLGYCLLGEISGRVYGKPYTKVVIQNYNIRKTTIKFIENKHLPDEVFYNYVETGLIGVGDIYTAFDYKGLASAAGLSGSAIDLAKQVYKMSKKDKPNILSGDSNYNCNMLVLRDCYGYAMFSYQKKPDDKKVYFRDGGLLGLSSLVVVSEDHQVIALLSNGTPRSQGMDIDRVKMQIYSQLNQ